MKYTGHRLRRDSWIVTKVSLNTKEAETILGQVNGQDMSWETYDRIYTALIALDKKASPNGLVKFVNYLKKEQSIQGTLDPDDLMQEYAEEFLSL